MIKLIAWKKLSSLEKNSILQRPSASKQQDLTEKCQAIINQVRAEGDRALKDFTAKFDGVTLTDLAVSADEFKQAEKKLTIASKKAIQQAAQQIRKFHQPQLPKTLMVDVAPGIRCEKQARPISKVGLYVPGGTAPLPSTVLMLGIPAQIANCPVRILCSPPQRDGQIDPHILWAAQQCGINSVFKIGGAQAIAALAYGTANIPKVDKIFGPGNAWVTQAKLLVAQDQAGAAFDLPAGPSEVMVIADKTARANFIAADLLSQAEHGVDSQVILICDDAKLAGQVQQQLTEQINYLPRKEIATAALKNSVIILVENLLAEASAIINCYAPEHLIIQTHQPRQWIEHIQAAGSVFLGAFSPESAGDYASGTNHVLPTYGYARSYSGLGVSDFMKQISFQELTREGLFSISETITTLAAIEGLTAHKNAVTIRFEEK